MPCNLTKHEEKKKKKLYPYKGMYIRSQKKKKETVCWQSYRFRLLMKSHLNVRWRVMFVVCGAWCVVRGVSFMICDA
jgi:hypothetical protein